MVDHTQTEINFDAPAPTPIRQADQPAYLILEMSKGAALGEPLKMFDKETPFDAPIRLTEQGIWKLNQFIKYPKGVSIRGKGEAVIKAEALWRLLLIVKPPHPSGFLLSVSKGAYHHVRITPRLHCGLGKEYVRIEINGKVEVKTGNFTATLPTIEDNDYE